MHKTIQQAGSPRHRTEHILAERDVLNVIDQCPQIIKEDKLFLRNKVKQIYRDYQLVDYYPGDDGTELLQIFNTCTKPLSKVHLYENHWHWLQVKLRKYVVNQKKKHKEECMNAFKREKMEGKGRKMMEKKIREECFSRPGRTGGISGHGSGCKGNSSQENRRPQSPTFSQSKKLAFTSRNRNLSGNVSPNYQTFTHFFGPQTCKNSQGRHNENRDWNKYQKLRQNKIQKQLFMDYQKPSAQIKQKQKQKVRERTKFKLSQPKKNESVIINQNCQNESYPQILQFNNNKKQAPYAYKPNPILQNDNDEVFDFNTINLAQRNRHKNTGSIISSLYENTQSDIFTAPELLEQCRRFIKKTEPDYKPPYPYPQPANLLNRYESPQFLPDSIGHNQRFASPKEMLKYIFRKDWTVFISQAEKQQLLERCPVGYDNVVSILLSDSELKTNFISFIDICPTVRKHLGVAFAFSNIFLLLDVDSKGLITHSDYETFLQNFSQCPLDPPILPSLRDKLQKFESAAQEIFPNHDIVPGCFQYMELMDRKEIYELGELLQMFEFEIDSRDNTEANDQV